MHADAFFAIGAGHLVCQDYARAGSLGRAGGPGARAYAVVADGCSSSPDTDFGARFLAAAAVRALLHEGADLDPARVIRDAARAADASLGRACLDATLLAAWAVPGGGVRVRVFGDGVVAVRRPGGALAVWDVAFSGGAPGYLSYLLEPARLERYVREGFGERTVVAWEGGARVGAERSWTGSGPGGRPSGFSWGIDLEAGAAEVVLLATDGVHSFRCEGVVGASAVPFGQVVEQLLDFRTLAGEFVARRCRSFLGRFCAGQGWRHADDLGVAAICLAGQGEA